MAQSKPSHRVLLPETHELLAGTYKMTSSSPLPTLLPLNAKPAERRITSRPSSAPLSARALRETNSQSKSSGKEVTVLTRERDELRVRYQHLQGLLREAQQTVTKQAAEIKALRRALAEGSTGNVDEDVSLLNERYLRNKSRLRFHPTQGCNYTDITRDNR